jgi:gluconate 2-dehydrogenase gamma chain
MKRRDLIKNIGLGSAGVVLATDASAQTSPKTAVVPEVQNGRLRQEIIKDNEIKAKKFFSLSEMNTIKVLVDMIIPADAKSGSATQAGVHDFIAFIANDMPQHQTPIRGGLLWLDNLCKKSFGQKFIGLNLRQRTQILDLIAYPKNAKAEHSQGVAFFSLIRNLTATGFYTSKMGLEDLGYLGNRPNAWDGVPQEVLAKYNLSYAEWEKHL